MRGLPLHRALYAMNMEAINEILKYHVDLNVLDALGQSCFEYMSRYPALAELLPPEKAASCSIPPREVAIRHILDRLKCRISRSLEKFDEAHPLLYWLGQQLLVLGDDKAAKVALSRDFTIKKPKNKDEEPTIQNKYSCWNCPISTGYFHECRDCAILELCSECVTKTCKTETPWCTGHTYLEVPSRNFVNFPKGVVNEEGQTLEEWLRELQVKFSSVNDEKGLAALGARNFNVDSRVEGTGILKMSLGLSTRYLSQQDRKSGRGGTPVLDGWDGVLTGVL
jgi:hypothetical protein